MVTCADLVCIMQVTNRARCLPSDLVVALQSVVVWSALVVLGSGNARPAHRLYLAASNKANTLTDIPDGESHSNAANKATASLEQDCGRVPLLENHDKLDAASLRLGFNKFNRILFGQDAKS